MLCTRIKGSFVNYAKHSNFEGLLLKFKIDCKSVASCFDGSNPSSPTKKSVLIEDGFLICNYIISRNYANVQSISIRATIPKKKLYNLKYFAGLELLQKSAKTSFIHIIKKQLIRNFTVK